MDDERIGQIRQAAMRRDILTIGDVQFLLAVIDKLRHPGRLQGNGKPYKLQHGRAIAIAGPSSVVPWFNKKGHVRGIKVFGAKSWGIELAESQGQNVE